MRVLILHSDDNKVQGYARALKTALEKEGSKADLIAAGSTGGAPVSSAPYQLVCLLSRFKGIFKPQIPAEVDSLLKRCTRLEGKKGAAFVPGRIGSTKALRAVMGLMEKQGVIVEDFGTLKSNADAETVAKRLSRLNKISS